MHSSCMQRAEGYTNNGAIPRSRLYCSYLQRRLLAAIDRCCAAEKQPVPAPRRLVRTVPSFVQCTACLLSSLLASSSFAPVNVYYSCTAQVEVLKVATTTCMRSQICMRLKLKYHRYRKRANMYGCRGEPCVFYSMSVPAQGMCLYTHVWDLVANRCEALVGTTI